MIDIFFSYLGVAKGIRKVIEDMRLMGNEQAVILMDAGINR